MIIKTNTWLCKAIASNFHIQDAIYLRKIAMLNLYLFFGCVVLSLITIFHIYFTNYEKVLFLDFIATSLFWFCFVYLFIFKRVNFVINLSSIVLVSFILCFVWINKNNDFGLIWTYFVPIFLMSLHGPKRGLLMSLFYYIGVFTIIYINIDNWHNTGWDHATLVRFLFSSIVLVSIFFISETIILNQNQILDTLSTTDYLTNLSNRRKIDSILANEISKVKRHKQDLSFAIIDIDNFKNVNDTFGHLVGDKVLVQLALIIKTSLRNIDSVGRWGGEEFCVILPYTNMQNSLLLLERLREEIKQANFNIGQSITCSFGVSSVSNNKFTFDELVNTADEMLYEAKRSGKDKICCRQL